MLNTMAIHRLLLFQHVSFDYTQIPFAWFNLLEKEKKSLERDTKQPPKTTEEKTVVYHLAFLL